MPREDRRVGPSANETGSKPAVLLLDDDERDLILLEQILRPDGFQVLKTTDPTRAFELLAGLSGDFFTGGRRQPKLDRRIGL